MNNPTKGTLFFITLYALSLGCRREELDFGRFKVDPCAQVQKEESEQDPSSQQGIFLNRLPATPVTPVSYDNNIRQIITNDCLTCHSPGDQPPALDSYESIKGSDGTFFVGKKTVDRVAQLKDMPPTGPLAVLQQDLFLAWKQLGFPKTPAEAQQKAAEIANVPNAPSTSIPQDNTTINGNNSSNTSGPILTDPPRGEPKETDNDHECPDPS